MCSSDLTAGAKLVAVEGADGKLEPAALRRAMQGAGNVHRVQPAAVSISQTTECGTLYRPAELAALCDFAHTHDLLVHLDGARLANALVSLDCSLAATTWQAGVDVASLGFTKNGALCAELVVVFEARRFPQLAFKRKRAGHLLSKSWFVAAQVLALLEDDRWLHQARHANAMASRLASGLLARGRELVWPTQANEVFVRLRAAERQQLRDAGHVFYDWPSGDDIARLVCSLRTSPDEVDTFLASVDRVHSA